MSKHLDNVTWTLENLPQGIIELANLSNLTIQSAKLSKKPDALSPEHIEDLERWMVWASQRLGLEAEAVETSIIEFDSFLLAVAPAILRINQNEFLLLLKSKYGKVRVLAPDLSVHSYSVDVLQSIIFEPYEKPILPEIKRLLALADIPKNKLSKVKKIMLQERLASQRIGNCWILRLPPTANFWQQLKHAGLFNRFLQMIVMITVIYGLEIIGWELIGSAALNGRLDFGWLSAWSLLIFSLIPLHIFSTWLDSTFALDIGRIMKKRLLSGALNMNLETVKHQGVGHLLSQVMESQALEALALNGGFSVVIASIELIFSAWILTLGSGGLLHLTLLFAWLMLTIFLCSHYFQRLRQWTLNRLNMTHSLIERMVGHRTRLAQDLPNRRNRQEDQMLFEYFSNSKSLDSSIIFITSILSRGWLLIGILGLTPAFVMQTGSSTTLAISLGGILLANRAFSGIAGGLNALSRAAIAWRNVSTLFNSASQLQPQETFLPTTTVNKEFSDSDVKLIDASDIVFRYSEKSEPILRGANLTIYAGERILFEGSSGGGKSTFASLLVGLRTAESGLLLLKGLDKATLGSSWHQFATEAPQFHENHIFTGTLAFNLLMGRNWPATESELEEAKEICIELGLDELLTRMPSGLLQMVGETGWQLSHGERSRIFLARALLQNAQLTILDESFAALDPESLAKCLNCALKRANTLLVIAHP